MALNALVDPFVLQHQKKCGTERVNRMIFSAEIETYQFLVTESDGFYAMLSFDWSATFFVVDKIIVGK